jgi:surface polysaccharide O-acyltransferase-like enzyme
LKKNITYLQNIHYFRGVAIIFIVFSHCFDLKISILYENTSIIAKVIKNLLPGGTIFFVFISGYLFSHIYCKNFSYGKFMYDKFKNVLLPFLFVSSITPFFYLTQVLYGFVLNSYSLPSYIEKITNYSFFETYILGHSGIIGLWYVPFIMVLFSLSPIYLKFFLFNYRQQLGIILFFLFLSMILHRSQISELKTIFQNLLYFTPVYLLGIIASSNHEILYSNLNRKEFYVFILLMIFATLLIQISNGTTEKLKHINSISFANFDLMIVQKLLFCLFFIIFLQQYNEKKIGILSVLAENSFGIFFIHGLYTWGLRTIVEKYQISFTSTSILGFFFSASLILILSTLTSILIRNTFPGKSKYLIGC